MKLASLLNKNLIFLGSPIKSKEEAIRMMVDHITRAYSFELVKEDIFTQVMEREKQGPTNLKVGISIPHIRLKIFNDFIISFCIPSNPIVENGLTIKMIVLIIASTVSPHLHLNTLAAMAKLGDSPDLFNKLLVAQTPQNFVEMIENSDLKVKKELLVEDIMSSGLTPVKEDTSLREVVNLMNENNTSYITVQGNNGQVGYELSLHDIIQKGIPDYALQLENISFLSTMGPFEDLLKNEDRIQVKEIMQPIEHFLSPEQTFLEATYMMVKTNKRNLPVIKDGKVLGVVSVMDVLNKVLRG